MRVALVLLWLIPAALLIRKNSLWTPVATLALTVSAAGLLRWRGVKVPTPIPKRVEASVISPPLEPPSRRGLFYLTCAGALILAAIMAEGTHRAVAAGVFMAGAAAVALGQISPEERERIGGRHRRASGVLALLLTIFGLIRWGMRSWLPPGDDYASSVQAAAPDRRPDDLTFRGVILFVEKPVEKIVPPSPAALKSGFADPRREPLVIPFSGVYWFLLAPDRLPPATALLQHGSPDELFYRVNDRRPMVMEAHQNLGRHLDISCCAAFDVDIVNVDPHPGSVFVEVRLGHMSLGVQPVQSSVFPQFGETKPRHETLHFPISAGRFGSFDEITVRFHLIPPRGTRSARMAIQRFVLRPGN